MNSVHDMLLLQELIILKFESQNGEEVQGYSNLFHYLHTRTRWVSLIFSCYFVWWYLFLEIFFEIMFSPIGFFVQSQFDRFQSSLLLLCYLTWHPPIAYAPFAPFRFPRALPQPLFLCHNPRPPFISSPLLYPPHPSLSLSRCGVIGNVTAPVRDMYLVPLSAEGSIPPQLRLLGVSSKFQWSWLYRSNLKISTLFLRFECCWNKVILERVMMR